MYENNVIENTFENEYLTGRYFSRFASELRFVAETENVSRIKEKQFVSAYVRYPPIPWSNQVDVFSGLDAGIIAALKNKECFFIIDASEEGYSPIETGWFDAFYYTLNLHQIDPKQVIFASSNLKDEDNIKNYVDLNCVVPIHVVSWNKFELHAELELQENTEKALEHIVRKTNSDFNGKYLFSSLSRATRPHKTLMQFLLWHKCKKYARLSHDCLEDLPPFENPKISSLPSGEWLATLPLIADYDDFSINWACRTPFQHLHTESLFQVVNETWGDMWEDRSAFYSEKTFMAISCFTPLIINGSVGINHHLASIGYKLYDDWFDLSFDFEKNYETRCLMIADQVTELCKKLSAMERHEQIAWKFKNIDLLKHNYEVLKNHAFSRAKFKNLLAVLEKQVS